MQQEAKHKEKEEEEKGSWGKKQEALLVRGRHRGSLSLLLPAVVPPSPVLPHKFSPSKNSRPAKSVPHSRQRQKRSRERWGSLYKDLRPHSNLKSLGPNAFNNWRSCHTFDTLGAHKKLTRRDQNVPMHRQQNLLACEFRSSCLYHCTIVSPDDLFWSLLLLVYTCNILKNQMGTNFQNPLVQVGQTSPSCCSFFTRCCCQ